MNFEKLAHHFITCVFIMIDDFKKNSYKYKHGRRIRLIYPYILGMNQNGHLSLWKKGVRGPIVHSNNTNDSQIASIGRLLSKYLESVESDYKSNIISDSDFYNRFDWDDDYE